MSTGYNNSSAYSNRHIVFVSILTGLLITVLLQLTIIFISRIKPMEKIIPELHVDWITYQYKQPLAETTKQLVPNTVVPQKKQAVDKHATLSRPQPAKNKLHSPLATNKKKLERASRQAEIPDISAVKDEDANHQALPVPVPIFKLSQTPGFLHKEPPVFPEGMRALGKAGVVQLSVLIDKYGKVRKVTILESAGAEFDRQAEKSMYASTFFAARVKDKPVASVLRITVKFNLI